MSDLISRQAAIEAMSSWEWQELYLPVHFKQLLEELPSAEPKRGKWEDIVELDSGGYPFKVGVSCSACGFETLSEDNYCPHCGAKMVVDDD
jgi:hypothetical protein